MLFFFSVSKYYWDRKALQNHTPHYKLATVRRTNWRHMRKALWKRQHRRRNAHWHPLTKWDCPFSLSALSLECLKWALEQDRDEWDVRTSSSRSLARPPLPRCTLSSISRKRQKGSLRWWDINCRNSEEDCVSWNTQNILATFRAKITDI